MTRAVLDTSVVVSAVLSRGSTPHKILRAWQKRKFELVTSPQILDELGRVLFYPKIKENRWMTDREARRLLTSMAHDSVIAAGKLNLRVIKDDPADDRFVIAAVEKKADYIVSGDSHLKKLKAYRGIRVVSPSEFLGIIQQHGRRA
ncbi:MAG: putative toxin-antitoxin system toxin component, PIN family [Chloroflexi bacterium]|nr:putative toxin-antitoxin system toxin component, PIN family [Chloroflexota bacterium]